MNRMDLNGHWYLSRTDAAETVFSAEVPGDVHKDLEMAGVIESPYFSDNSTKCAWVTEHDWKYTKEFFVDKLDEKSYLVFDGIDTFSEIYLNGAKVADTDNMFMQYRIDVSEVIEIGKNKLEVIIKSIKNEMSKYPDEGYFGCFNVQRIFVRKAQCHFSWDWAPDFPAAGIWKDVYFETSHDTYIHDHHIKTDLDGTVTFFVNLSENSRRDIEREIIIEIDGKVYKKTTSELHNFFIVKLESPKLWWPRGMGEQNLYNYSIKLSSNGDVCDCKSGRFGIRKVRFEEKADVEHEGFICRLYVNNKPVFMKGANWVPLDVMTGCISKERYKQAIMLAYEANFNILRVWGGGIYENDVFYELCDELGIMVWQDLAYACADVPDNMPDFVDNAIKEAEYQVRRLRNFTSLVLYCGGNEKTGSHGLNKKYGDKIIYYYIRGVVQHLDGTRPYFPSSPWGYGDIGNTQSSGDCHCNSYQSAMTSPENKSAPGIEHFRDVLKKFKATLVSEIAIQGAPLPSSLKKYIPSDKLWPINEIYDLHFMRNPYDGTGKYFAQIQYECAEKLFGPISGLYDFCKKSSILHSELIRADCEFHKSRMEACTGTMTWMFNDIWPCGTWSIVDYYLSPMPAYYALKRAYLPQRFIITKTEAGYAVYVVNENDVILDYSAEIGIQDLNGKIIAERTDVAGTVGSHESKLIYLFETNVSDNAFMFVKGIVGEIKHEDTLFGALWKDIHWPEPEIDVVYETVVDGIKATVKSKRYARAVNFASRTRSDLVYEDNYFDLMPGSEKAIFIKGENLTDVEIIMRDWTSEWDF